MTRTVVAALFLTACAAAPAPPPSTGPLSLVERWELTALRDDDGRRLPAVRRWEQPLHVLAYYPGDYESDVAAMAERLGALTGLPMTFSSILGTRDRPMVGVSGSDNRPTILVAFGNEADIAPVADSLARAIGRERTGTFTCFFIAAPGEPLRLYIRNDLDPGHTRACIAQELAQALGLPGDLDGRTDTAFVSGGGPSVLTPEDEAVIRLHYSPELRNGMPADEALAVVRQLAGS